MNAAPEKNLVTVPTAEHKHPLRALKPAKFQTFEEWLAQWKAAKYQAEMLGLLHCLADEENYILNVPEGVSFALEIADDYDGYFDGYEDYDRQELARARKTIAQKAFQVLCLKFFKTPTRFEEKPHWWWMLSHEVLFQKVLWFLRPEQRNYWYESERLDHPQDLFQKFLEEFPQVGWEYPSLYHRYEGRWSQEDDGMQARMIAARPRFVEIILKTRRVHWLSGQELDDACIAKLTELALREKLSLPPKLDGSHEDTHRKPESLEEAALGGSVPAKMLLLHKIIGEERQRLAALYEVEEKRRALDKRAERLKKR